MADEQPPAHRDGEIISTTVDDDGTIHVATYRDGEPYTRTFGHENAMKDGVEISPSDRQMVANDPISNPYEGEILSAHVGEDGKIQVQQYVAGEVQTSSHGDDTVAPPMATPVEFSPVVELDAWVHQAADASQPYQAEPIVEAVGSDPIPSTVLSQQITEDGQVLTTVHYPDGHSATSGLVEQAAQYEAPPTPMMIEFAITPNAGPPDAVIDASSAHGESHDDAVGSHYEATGPEPTPVQGHEAAQDTPSGASYHDHPAPQHESDTTAEGGS